MRERIADFHAKNAELEKQLEAHRQEIASLEADLKETTEVKERLQMAEGSSPAPAQTPGAVSVAADKLPMTTMIGTPDRALTAAPVPDETRQRRDRPPGQSRGGASTPRLARSQWDLPARMVAMLGELACPFAPTTSCRLSRAST